jgi:hypothetical protein
VGHLYAVHNLDKPGVLHNLLHTNKRNNGMHDNNKKLLLDILEEAGSFDYVWRTLKELMEDIEEQVEKMERVTGKRNEELRALLQGLKV